MNKLGYIYPVNYKGLTNNSDIAITSKKIESNHYYQKSGFGANGVWNDVEIAYSGANMGKVYALSTEVNGLRNTCCTRVEVKLLEVNEAWENIGKLVECLSLMSIDVSN